MTLAIDILIALIVVTTAAVSFHSAGAIIRPAFGLLLLSALVDVVIVWNEVLQNRAHHADLLTDMCSNTTRVALYAELHSICTKSTAFLAQPIAKRMQLRLAEHAELAYFHVIGRWATETYMQGLVFVFVMFVIYQLFTYMQTSNAMQLKREEQQREGDLRIRELEQRSAHDARQIAVNNRLVDELARMHSSRVIEPVPQIVDVTEEQ